MLLLSDTTTHEMLNCQNRANLLLQTWDRVYGRGVPMMTILRIGAGFLYAYGARYSPLNRRELNIAAMLTIIGDPVGYFTMNVVTIKLYEWKVESDDYDYIYSVTQAEAARELIFWWNALYFLRSVEVLIGVWVGMSNMPEYDGEVDQNILQAR